MTLNIKIGIGILLCLATFSYTTQLFALDNAPRLDSTASAAVGVGLEVSHGDYGRGVDATLVTLPLSIYLYPTELWDITIEVPFLYLTRKADSGVIITRSGGVGRGRGANSSQKTATTATVRESGLGEINMTSGWTLLKEGERTPNVRPTFYLKAPSGDPERGLGTGTVEAGPGLSVSKWLDNVQLFGEGSYLFQNSKSDYAGRNYIRYLGGVGLQATQRLFVAAQFKGSSSRSDGAEAQAEGEIKLNFLHSRRFSWQIYGSAGFTDASPDYGGGMMITYRF